MPGGGTGGPLGGIPPGGNPGGGIPGGGIPRPIITGGIPGGGIRPVTNKIISEYCMGIHRIGH